MDDHLAKDAQYVGEWFLPNSSEKIPGVLKYESGQIRLQLLRHSGLGKNNIKIIYGTTDRGNVTLVDVIFHSMLPFRTARGAIFGEFVDGENQIKKVSFNFDLLNQWAISKYPLDFPKQVSDHTSYRDKTSEEFTVKINNDLDCILLISHGKSWSYLNGTKEFSASHFSIKSKGGMKLYDLQNYIRGLQYFLMLVMGKNLNLSELFRGDENQSRCPIYVHLSRKPIRGGKFDHFFNISHIRENYEEILGTWFDFYRKNAYLLRLFFVTYDRDYVEHLDFFVYAALLEGYAKTTSTLEKEYKPRIACVLQQYFANDFTNLSEFINEIDSMRHDHFHFNRRDKLDEELLFQLTYDLFFLIRIIFLNHIGCNVTINTPQHPICFKFLKKL